MPRYFLDKDSQPFSKYGLCRWCNKWNKLCRLGHCCCSFECSGRIEKERIRGYQFQRPLSALATAKRHREKIRKPPIVIVVNAYTNSKERKVLGALKELVKER
jgi:hypothetical protein